MGELLQFPFSDMGNYKLLVAVFAAVVALSDAQFQIGLGRADCTGPAAEVPFV